MNSKYKITSKSWDWQRIENMVGAILCVIVIFFALRSCLIQTQEEKEIRGNAAITTGEIEKIMKNRSKYTAYYGYWINNTHYQAMFGSVRGRKLFGQHFPVIYSIKNPQISRMLIYPENFEKYGLIFPDSLRAIVKE